MKRTLVALVAGVLTAGAGAGTAAADPAAPPGGSSPQTVAQLAGSSQQAQASATSTQIKPENTNVAVRVLSPGSSGSVSQSNTSTAAGIAANANQLAQSATQGAGAPNPSGYSTPAQSAGQVAFSNQDADAWADSTQVKPKNTNVSVRVLSPGEDGDVTQENASTALALGLNKNHTDQTATQEASGGSPVQAVEQAAKSEQDAAASAESKQIEPKNTNVSVRVLSRGNNGSVEQKNSSKAIAVGANLNRTEQTATQAGDGYGLPIQEAGQVAVSNQDADAWADSTQVKPKNTNVSVRVLSPGDEGDVRQENKSTALGVALNANDTDQTATQEQGGRYGDVAVQAAGQIASSNQDAWASAESKQIEPENTNLSVPLLGHGEEDGSVSQRNSSAALAASLNINDLTQTAAQSQGGGMSPSPRSSKQAMPLEDALGIREPDEEDASVSQENKSLAAALSANLNDTTQTATQSQEGKADVGVQALGQVASNTQKAGAYADSFQLGARNENGRLSGPELCKHDGCKPDREQSPCTHDPWECKPHDWDRDKCTHERDWPHACKRDPCERKCDPWVRKSDRCKPDFKRHDRCKDRPRDCQPKRCDPCKDPRPCKHERYGPYPQEAR